MKISIDKNKCIKCGLCASICPEVFVLKEDGAAVKDEGVIDENNKELVDRIKMAEKNCPIGAVKIE